MGNENFSLEHYKRLSKELNSKNFSNFNIEYQREIKSKLSKELERIISLYDFGKEEFNNLSANISDVKNDIMGLQALQTRGYDVSSAINQAINNENTLNEKITESGAKLDEQREIIKIIESILKTNKYSEQKKKLSDLKIKVKQTPQKVCTANIKLLTRIRTKGSNKYRDLVDKFNMKFAKSEKLMQNFEEERNNILNNDLNNTAFERYSKSLEIEKRQRKTFKKIKRYAHQANILSHLKSGIVRSIDIPLDMYNKMNLKYEGNAKAA